MIYIGALLKSLAGVMKQAVSTGNSSSHKGISSAGGAARLGSATVERAVCVQNVVLPFNGFRWRTGDEGGTFVLGAFTASWVG